MTFRTSISLVWISVSKLFFLFSIKGKRVRFAIHIRFEGQRRKIIFRASYLLIFRILFTMFLRMWAVM